MMRRMIGSKLGSRKCDKSSIYLLVKCFQVCHAVETNTIICFFFSLALGYSSKLYQKDCVPLNVKNCIEENDVYSTYTWNRLYFVEQYFWIDITYFRI